MVRIDLEDAGSSTYCFSGWQCLLCGEVTDPGIEANRECRAEPRRNGARPPGTVPVGFGVLQREWNRN
jgi:hypothetical protein